jgi:hypothetical protein
MNRSATSKQHVPLISELDCRIKQLELRLRLVEGEKIDDVETSFDINDMKKKCNYDDNSSEFKIFNKKIKSKKIDDEQKEQDDKYKETIDLLNLYLPILSILTAFSLPFLINKGANEGITEGNIENATNTFSKIAPLILTSFMDVSVPTVDLYSKAYDIYPIIKENKISVSKIRNAIPVVSINKFIPKIITTIKRNITSNISAILGNNNVENSRRRKKLFYSFSSLYLSTFIIILFIQTIGVDSDLEKNFLNMSATDFLPNSIGGKKTKKTRKTKPKTTSISKKIK